MKHPKEARMAATILGVIAASSEHWLFSLSFRLLETRRVKFPDSFTFIRAPTSIPNWWYRVLDGAISSEVCLMTWLTVPILT